MNMMGSDNCIICNRSETQDAHVKPQRAFSHGEDDRYHNIVNLCHIHHDEYFDKGKVGICREKQHMVVEKVPGELELVNLESALNIKDEYIEYRNRICNDRIRHAMGLTHDSHQDLCSE